MIATVLFPSLDEILEPDFEVHSCYPKSITQEHKERETLFEPPCSILVVSSLRLLRFVHEARRSSGTEGLELHLHRVSLVLPSFFFWFTD